MTDKEKRELKDGVINIFKRFNILDHTATIGNLRDDILKYINSLQEENVSDDLEKEMDKEWNKCEPIDEGMGLEIASIEHEQFDNIARHFFEFGLKTKGE